MQGFASFAIGKEFPIFDNAGGVDWGNVAVAATLSAANGCAGAAAAGGDCGRAALANAAGTVGSAFGNVGAVIAGCAAGKISGGSCRQGAVHAMEAYAVNRAIYSATEYMKKSAAKPNSFLPALVLAPEAAVLAGEVVVGTGLAVGVAAAWDEFSNWIFNVNESELGENAPKDAPRGTIGLDQAGRKNGWGKDTTHGIKDNATGGMAGGKTWIGVAPDGTVGINEGGRWSPQGHYDELKP